MNVACVEFRCSYLVLSVDLRQKINLFSSCDWSIFKIYNGNRITLRLAMTRYIKGCSFDIRSARDMNSAVLVTLVYLI